jgi:hypothetical protein
MQTVRGREAASKAGLRRPGELVGAQGGGEGGSGGLGIASTQPMRPLQRGSTAKNCGALGRVSTAWRAIRAATRLFSSTSETVGAMPWMIAARIP